MPSLSRRSLLLSFLALLAIGVGLDATIPADAVADVWSGALLKIQAVQRDLHRQLAEAMRAVHAKGAAAAWTVVLLSFLYGVFHAAGPGHGKIVISTYLLTQESQLRRGLVLSLVASLCQGLTAVVVVFGTIGLLSLPMRVVKGAATDLEMLSYGLVAVVGFALVLGRARRLWRRRGQTSRRLDHEFEHLDPSAHDHDDGPGCRTCGHTHGPSPRQLEARVSWKGLAGIIASIGLRPCTGAVLVLLVSVSMDLRWAGVAAVFAMALGTAITVSLLATLAVYARKTSLRLAANLPESDSLMATVIDVVGLVGGALIAIVGALLFQSIWSAPIHPLQ